MSERDSDLELSRKGCQGTGEGNECLLKRMSQRGIEWFAAEDSNAQISSHAIIPQVLYEF